MQNQDKLIETQKNSLNEIETISLYGDTFNSFMNIIDNTFKASIELCYTNWCSIGDPCVAQDMINGMIDVY